MVRESDFGEGRLRIPFSGREVTDLLFNFFFWGFKWRNNGLWTEGRGSMVKCGKTPLEGEGHVKTRETLCMISVNNGPMETIMLNTCGWIYSVHARLDNWIWSQNYRNTLLWHECSTSECTKWDAVMAGGDELGKNSNPLLGLAFDATTWWNGFMYSKQNWKWMLARLKEREYWVLTWLHAS